MPLENRSVLDSVSSVKQRDMVDSASEIAVALLTGGIDRPYAFGLSLALASKGVKLDVIGSRELDSPEMQTSSKLTFLKRSATKDWFDEEVIAGPNVLCAASALRGYGQAKSFPRSLELQVPTLRPNSAPAVLQGARQEDRLHRA